MKKIIAVSFFTIAVIILGVKFGRAEQSDGNADIQDVINQEAGDLDENSYDFKQDITRSVAGEATEEARKIVFESNIDGIGPIGKSIQMMREKSEKQKDQSLYEEYKTGDLEKMFEKIKNKTDEM